MSDRESECALPDGARPLPPSFGVSFDLIVFDAVEPLTPESIQQRFSEAEARFAVGDAEFPEANPATPRLQAFLTDLEARWPDLDSREPAGRKARGRAASSWTTDRSC